jgi:hypothetical protein
VRHVILIITIFLFSTAIWAKDKDAKPEALLARIEALEASLAENVPFSGAYFSQNLAEDPATDSLFALHSDGTFTSSLAGMFCNPNTPPDCDLTAPEQGTWKKTGENEVSVVYIQFGTDAAAGGDFTDGGRIFKITWVQTFDDLQDGVFQHWVVDSFVVNGYSFDQNPITDSPNFAVEVFSSPFAGQRINVVE